MSRRRLLLVVVGAILAADIAGALVYYQATRRTLQANRFAVSTRPAGTIPADAALVFCEGVGDRHGLSRTTALRLEFAAGLLRAKQVRHVAGIGGNWGETRGGRGMRAILREASVPAPNAHGEPHSYDTLTNADAFWKMLNERNWRDVVVVSSPIHLHRILYLLRHHDQSRATAFVYCRIRRTGARYASWTTGAKSIMNGLPGPCCMPCPAPGFARLCARRGNRAASYPIVIPAAGA